MPSTRPRHRLHGFDARALILVALLGSCSPGTERVSVAEVLLSAPSASFTVGASQQLVATPRDDQGTPLSDRAVMWASDNAGVATVAATGLASAVSVGTARITASSEGRSGSVQLTVTPVPVATVTVLPAVDTLLPGQSESLRVELRDLAGAMLTGRAVSWGSQQPTVATVTTLGVVTAVGVGTAAITATSEGRQGTAQLVVLSSLPPPVIASVSPDPLVPGGTARIRGTNFDASITPNAVTIGGAMATVLGASPVELVVEVPCVQSGRHAVVVAVHGSPSAAVQASLLAPQRALAVGESVVLTDHEASRCNELVPAAPSARYLVTLFSAATSSNTQVDAELGGNAPIGALRAEPTPGTPAVHASRRATLFTDGSVAERARAADHWAMLERNRADYERLRAIAPRATAPGVTAPGVTAPGVTAATSTAESDPPPALGTTRRIFYVRGTTCADSSQVILGRAIRVGTRSVIWEDQDNTLRSSADANLAGYYERLGRIFDEEQYGSVRRNFGDPLRRDAVTDADGLVHMVFTQRLVGSGAAAYVTSCDQFPRSVSPGGNFGQFFYGYVPTLAGSNVASTSYADGWFYFMARTIVHEVKHIASHSARVANGAPAYEQSWLEEGTARHAEELWARESMHRVAWKGNTGFGTAATGGLYCDFHPADATCNGADPLRRPGYGMRRQFNEIRNKLLEPWNWSPYGDATGQTGSVFYQTTWSLVRWTIDRFASSDSAFLNALTNSSANGTTNLTAVAGVPMERLIGGWGLALFADDYPGFSAPADDIGFPTWNLRNIYRALHDAPDWASRWTTPFPITPTPLAFGAFTASHFGIRGGAQAYFELSGATAGTQLLRLLSPGGGPPSTSLRIAIARLQ